MRTIKWALVLALLSCVGNPKPPNDILSKEKIAEMLVDIHLAEARVSKMNLGSMDSSVVVFNKLQQEIWAKHEVDSALYKKSYAYYASNPEEMGSVYEIVTQNLEKTDTTSATSP